jgi:hypothetical protein
MNAQWGPTGKIDFQLAEKIFLKFFKLVSKFFAIISESFF